MATIDAIPKKIFNGNSCTTNLHACSLCIADTILGCPVILRTDLGTENSMVSYLQPFLRRHSTDSLVHSCFLYGKSTSNQVL